MFKYIKRCLLIIIFCGSFIGSDKFVKYLKEKDPIYLSIMDLESEYKVLPVNAIIDGKHIVPGLNGRRIDVDKSYSKMKGIGAFMVSKLVMKEESPEISIINNYDKIIVGGNPLKKGVSLVTNSEELGSFLDDEVVSYAILTTLNNYENKYVYGTRINDDINHYNELEKKLKHDKQWNNLCYFEEELYNFCIKSKKLIFMPSLILDSNYLHVYRSIRSGDIIFLNDDLTKDGLSFVLTQIRFNGLEILPLSLLLSESR